MQISIKKRGAGLIDIDHDELARRLRFNLSRYGPKVRRLEVCMEGDTSSGGEENHVVNIRILLSGFPDIHVKDIETDLRFAVDRAIGKATRSVRQLMAATRANQGTS